MARPVRFEPFRYLGDKRTQVVHDLDNAVDECAIDDIVASGQGTTFGPDIVPEARNRGYKPCSRCNVESEPDE